MWKKIYEGNVQGLLATLIKKEMITPEDYAKLQEFWDRGENDE